MKQNIILTLTTIRDVLDKLRGAVMIVYPMGLPAYDEVHAILENDEDLAGKQASKDVRLALATLARGPLHTC